MNEITGHVYDTSTYGWIADVVVNNTNPGDVTQEYVDGSLNARDLLINQNTVDISSNRSDLGLKANDASIYYRDYIDGSFNTIDLYQDIQDASILALEVSIGSGITYEYVDGSLAERDVSITYLDNNKLNNTTDNLIGVLTIDGSLVVNGDIIVDGSGYIVDAETIKTKSDFIIMRDGAIAAIADGSISGLQVIKADGTNDVLLGAGNDAIMRVGWSGDELQAIATREDTPTDGDFGYWDDSSAMIKFKQVEVGDTSKYISQVIRASGFGISLIYTTEVTAGGIKSVVMKEFFDSNTTVANSIESGISIDVKPELFVKNASLGDTLVYENGVLDVSGGGGTTINELNDIGDVNVDTKVEGDLIQYNETDSTWDNVAPVDISTLTIDAADYFIPEASFGSSFEWVGGYIESTGGVTMDYVDGSLAARDTSIAFLDSSVTWLYENTSGNLSELSDVDVSTKVDGDLIQYNDTTSTWDNVAPVDISTLTLDASDFFFQKIGGNIFGDTYLTLEDDVTTAYGRIGKQADYNALEIQGLDGLFLDSPSWINTEWADYDGAYLTVGHNGQIVLATPVDPSTVWQDTVTTPVSVSANAATDCGLSVIPNSDVNAGSVEWNVQYTNDSNQEAIVTLQLSVDNVAVGGGTEYTIPKGDTTTFFGSSPVSFTIANGEDLDIQVTSNKDGTIEESFLRLKKNTVGVRQLSSGIKAIDGSLVIGDYDGGHYTEIGTDGTLRLHGDATAFDDLVVPLTQGKQGNTAKPDFDYDDLAYMFPQNNDNETLYFVIQMPHKRKYGSELEAHVHYKQEEESNLPVFKIDYKLFNLGETPPATWTTHTLDGSVFAWNGDDTHQLAEGLNIDASTIGISAMMLVKLYRDDNVVTGDVAAWQFDLHYEIDSFGSETEYNKA